MGQISVHGARSVAPLSLPATHWKQLRDTRCPRSLRAVDHVVVGPSGVNVITYRSPASVDDAVARRAAREVAGEVRDLLPDRYRSTVNPIMCHRDREPLAEMVDGVMVTSLMVVEHIVRSSPPRMSTSEVAEVFAHLQARLEPTPAVPADSPSARTRLRALFAFGAAVSAAAAGAVVVASRLPDMAGIW